MVGPEPLIHLQDYNMASRFAATTSFTDVNNAVNGIGTMSSGTSYSTPAVDGDTVAVPAGTSS